MSQITERNNLYSSQIKNNYKYPVLEININKIYENVKYMVEFCKSQDISVAGVVKGFNALPKVVEQFVKGGCEYIASSRMDQIITLKEWGIEAPFMLIRIPMLNEIKELVKYVDVSLNSELETIKQIEAECKLQNKKHKVVIMYDLGDLREGIIGEKEFMKLALHIEKELERVELFGIGTNLGCYGSVKPTENNLNKLCTIAEKIESRINRRLDMISGGATSSLPLVMDGKIPKRINNLRIGEGIILARDLKHFWGYDMKDMNQDTFILKAQVIEIKDKPSHPIGELFVDAFGNKPSFRDRGIRRRALLAVGKQDFASHDQLIPRTKGIEIVGSSSDHLIVDIENCKEQIRLGDILDFYMFYQPMLFLSGSASVTKVYI
ncbi:alanine racemase [Paramaledivibacter caminithermalis]|uniref:Predicted amino acid racemase n=1 Tax=Paramaledivibacter caminithermalis (strain DSM 15212 / CIP 107654 / DViRD3) TaxID=1121301 RepID=A0A1M6SY32_PARC5|nr:alanine/ornithine racemase family PLP-dependent enzyme [Paramaledivibacter caminithermalis]SHK49478.1 Predicted amino acid racemase [Paramaledivibacter caminithermalis DSM 15212]